MIFINFGIIIINASLVVSGVVAKTSSLDVVTMITLGFTDRLEMKLVYAILSISAFGLIVLTFGFVLAVFSISTIISNDIIVQLQLPVQYTVPLMFGVTLIYVMGFNQYRAREQF
jgi:hypothetical protein